MRAALNQTAANYAATGSYGSEADAIQPTLTHRLRNIEEILDGANELAASILSKINGGGNLVSKDGALAPRAVGLAFDVEEVANRVYRLEAVLRDINAQL